MTDSPMSIKDRIAALKAKEATTPTASKTPTAEKKEEGEDQAEVKEGGVARRPSVADRIAAMKAQSAAASAASSPGPGPKSPIIVKSPTVAAAPSPASQPTPSAGCAAVPAPSEDKEAEATATAASADAPTASEKPKSSIADRIAALKNSNPAANQPPIKASPMPVPSAAPQNRGLPPSAPADANSAAAEPSSADGNPVASAPASKRSSIADRIAALKSSGPGGSLPIMTAAPAVEPKRRLSTDRVAFAKAINLAGLTGAPRPIPKPQEDEDAASGSQGGREEESREMSHMNLTRAAVPSVKRKRAVTSVRLSSDWLSTATEDLSSMSINTTSYSTAATLTTAATVALSTGGSDAAEAILENSREEDEENQNDS